MSRNVLFTHTLCLSLSVKLRGIPSSILAMGHHEVVNHLIPLHTIRSNFAQHYNSTLEYMFKEEKRAKNKEREKDRWGYIIIQFSKPKGINKISKTWQYSTKYEKHEGTLPNFENSTHQPKRNGRDLLTITHKTKERIHIHATKLYDPCWRDCADWCVIQSCDVLIEWEGSCQASSDQSYRS